MPSGWFRFEGVEVFAWPLWTLPADDNTLDAVWNVGWAYGDWKFAWASSGGLEATISETHGVPAPNSIDHNVDLDIFAMCAAARPRGGGPLTPSLCRCSASPLTGASTRLGRAGTGTSPRWASTRASTAGGDTAGGRAAADAVGGAAAGGAVGRGGAVAGRPLRVADRAGDAAARREWLSLLLVAGSDRQGRFGPVGVPAGASD